MTTGTGIGHIFDIVIDVSDLDRAAAFWSAVFGGRETYRGGPYVVLATEDGQMLTLQKVPEVKQVKNRMHLDIAVPDVDAAMEQIISLGGSRVSQWVSQRGMEPLRGFIGADPDGNEFCLGTANGWSYIKG